MDPYFAIIRVKIKCTRDKNSQFEENLKMQYDHSPTFEINFLANKVRLAS